MSELQNRIVRGIYAWEMSEGKRFNNQKEPVKVNHLIFILEGEVSIVKDNECAISVRAGEFVFIPISSLYVGTVIRPGRYLDLTFSTIISPCATNTCCRIIWRV